MYIVPRPKRPFNYQSPSKEPLNDCKPANNSMRVNIANLA